MDNGFEIQRRLARVTRYNCWLYDSFRDHLGARILDAGCGYGNVTRFLLQGRERVIGLDHSPAFYEAVRDRFASRDSFRAVLGDLADAGLLASLAGERLDTVVCVNVLEHLKDDVAALGAFHALLPPGGALVLLVPAHGWLFGSLDRADAHYRRYSRRGLAGRVREAGFRVVELRWLNLAGIAGWFLNGTILRRTFVPEAQYAAYDRIVPLLRAIESRVPVPIGLSLLCIGSKSPGP